MILLCVLFFLNRIIHHPAWPVALGLGLVFPLKLQKTKTMLSVFLFLMFGVLFCDFPLPPFSFSISAYDSDGAMSIKSTKSTKSAMSIVDDDVVTTPTRRYAMVRCCVFGLTYVHTL